MYEKVKAEVSWDTTSKAPIGITWVDNNKGDEANPECRSRLVARHIKYNSKEKNRFAATPPLEAQTLLFSMAVAEGVGFKRGKRQRGLKLVF